MTTSSPLNDLTNSSPGGKTHSGSDTDSEGPRGTRKLKHKGSNLPWHKAAPGSRCGSAVASEAPTFEPRTPGRRGSESTVTDSDISDRERLAELPRPSAIPKGRSPQQLPALCNDADSDDEFLAPRRPEGREGLELLATASFVVDRQDLTDFTFTAKFSVASYQKQEVTAVLVLETMKKALLKQHPRPSNEDLYSSSDSTVAFLKNPTSFAAGQEAKLHERICEQSKSSDPQSYAQASPFIQRAVRTLLELFPTLSPDALTPIALVDAVLRCPYGSCPDHFRPERRLAEQHIRAKHWPTVDLAQPQADLSKEEVTCPLCPKSMQVGSLGRHVYIKHYQQLLAADGPVICKLCDTRCLTISDYVQKHFAPCAKAHSRVQEPPRKKQRRA
ncbi:hypothetical protein B0H15DRAFT_1027152 [Mycena belliarum]|uniref:Uncharacterized protein n=1 Tax=Mycena belliarum TaxID=1033014 RepID=A0AAD6TRG3_9AGAR|nr:hypothetical protein B0H15DRAFT_1027152 [Mycena belliae]